MQDSDTGISATFNVSIYYVLQCVAIIGCTDFEQHDKYIYNFESTSQIIELELQ